MKIATLLSFLFLISCRPYYKSQVSSYTIPAVQSTPNYADLAFWAAHPYKWDPSDSLPKGLKQIDTLADVFFIHPTTYTDQYKGRNADVSDPRLAAKTDFTSILYQASVFNEHCRVFAPRYSQAYISSFYELGFSAEKAWDKAYADIKEAFKYYLANHRKDRPFFIAAHSQGALHSIRLIKEFIDTTELRKSMVGAYIIGWPVTTDDFKNIPLCSVPGETGCFASWRTFRKDYIPEYILEEEKEALVINPLTWTRDKSPAPKELNKGAVLRNFSEPVFKVSDAMIGPGVLWITKPDFSGAGFLKNYHIADINLFYFNIRENISNQIKSFKRKEH